MIKDLLTIIIPCRNSVKELKLTTENLLKKVKIKNTRIIVLDFGSIDGSYQYVAQASSEFIRIVKIESIKMEEGQNIKDIYNLIDTPYVMVVTPGSTIKNEDLLISSINDLIKIEYPIAYLRRSDFIDNILSNLIKKKRKIVILFSNKEFLEKIEYKYENNNPDISILNLSTGIKIGGFTD